MVRADTYPGTSQQVRDELDAIIGSLRIETPPEPALSPVLTAGLPPICETGSGADGKLDPGRYVMPGPGSDCSVRSRGWPDKAVSVEVPEGWSYRGPPFGSALDRESARLQMGVVDHVYEDPCREGSTVTGPSSDDLVAALSAMRGVQVTAPEAITLDGYAGVRMDLAMPTAAPTCEFHRLWDTETSNGTFGLQSGTGWIHRLWILDVEGVRFVLDASRAPDTLPEVQAELDAMVRSVDFGPSSGS